MENVQESINPFSERVFEEYPLQSVEQCLGLLPEVERAQNEWTTTSIEQRTEILEQCASHLRKHKGDLAVLMSEEMGKLLTESIAEVEKCAWLCEYYAETGVEAISPIVRPSEAKNSFICFEPLGIVLAVMPWNFPFWQVFRCAVPNLLAGNAVLLKHATNVPGCALMLEHIFRDAGFPSNLFRSLLTKRDTVPELLKSPAVHGVAFTGSIEAGKAVARAAGENLKRSVLELGGSDPYVILEDIDDMETVVETCIKSRLICNGQSCIAAKRFIVVRSRMAEFQELFVEKMKDAHCGDPLSADTVLGPLATKELRNSLHEQVNATTKAGAKILLGGDIPERTGYFYPPTILTNIPAQTPAFADELFGPVASLFETATEEEAIQLANQSRFGLGAAVFTSNLKKGEEIARTRLQAGNCVVNGLVKSDPRFPFGGVKESGYGRELSEFGIREFVNIKTVMVN